MITEDYVNFECAKLLKEKDTDVFIDKAIEKLKNLSAGFWIDHLVYEFKKAMKGE